MSNSTSELVAILSEKEGAFEELIRLLQEEQTSIVNIDVANLEAVDDKKRELLVQIEDSSNRLRQVLKQVASDVGMPENTTLSKLLSKMDSPNRSLLQGLQTRLLDHQSRVDRALRFNMDLLQGSLNIVNRSLGFFGGMFKRSTTYGQAGGMVTSPADVRLVCKEI